MLERNQVTERLRQLVIELQLSPGDRLPPERHLAVQLGVARSSLREGLRRLLDLGIVEARQGSGTYLAQIDLEELLELRLRLEPYAARLAAERRDAQQLAALLASAAEVGATERDPIAFAAADTRLHELVAEASHNRSLAVVLAAISDLLRYSRGHTAPDSELRAATHAQLDALVEAIRAKDVVKAEQTMHEHLSDVRQAIKRRTKKR